MTNWTYIDNQLAHFGDGFVIVPDQIADEQKQHDAERTIFPAFRCRSTGIRLSDRAVHVRLDGDSYGLYTAGIGNMRVRMANHPNRAKCTLEKTLNDFFKP